MQYGEDTSSADRLISGGQGNRTERNRCGTAPQSGMGHIVLEVGLRKDGCNVEASASGFGIENACRRSPSPRAYHPELVCLTHTIHSLPYVTYLWTYSAANVIVLMLHVMLRDSVLKHECHVLRALSVVRTAVTVYVLLDGHCHECLR